MRVYLFVGKTLTIVHRENLKKYVIDKNGPLTLTPFKHPQTRSKEKMKLIFKLLNKHGKCIKIEPTITVKYGRLQKQLFMEYEITPRLKIIIDGIISLPTKKLQNVAEDKIIREIIIRKFS